MTGARVRRGRIAASLVLAACAALGGCSAVRTQVGPAVDPAPLESKLRVGESMAADVRAALGEPTSVGREMLPFHREPRTVWSYHHEEGWFELGGSGDARRIFLLVFLAGDRYDGYLWFSSLAQHRAAAGQ